MTLTPEERHRIVHLRLNGMSVRSVAEETGHAPNTVTKTWRLHMAESATVRRDDLDVQREEIVQRLEMAAWEAREAGEEARRAGHRTGHVRFLREEREALREIARLTGIDRPVHRRPPPAPLDNSEDARQRLTDHLLGLVEKQNAEDRGEGHPQPDWRSQPDDPSAIT